MAPLKGSIRAPWKGSIGVQGPCKGIYRPYAAQGLRWCLSRHLPRVPLRDHKGSIGCRVLGFKVQGLGP